MAEPMTVLSPEKLNTTTHSITDDDDFDMTFHDPPSSPFVEHLDSNDQENVAPTPVKASLIDIGDDVPQSAFKVSPEKKFGLKDRTSPSKMSPAKNLMEDFEEAASRGSPKKSSPVKRMTMERPESAMSGRSSKSQSPLKSSRAESVESIQRNPESMYEDALQITKRPSSSDDDSVLRENEGLTVAMKIMEETHTEHYTEHTQRSVSYQSYSGQAEQDDITGLDFTDFNPDGPEISSVDVDDTCISTFSEMPPLDMTKFAVLRKSPTKNGGFEQSTPRARTLMTPSTVRRSDRTPSPTPRASRKENDTTNLLLDFTAQIEAFSASRRGSPLRERASPSKSTTQPDLRSYYSNQRSPAKSGAAPAAHVPGTPAGQNRQLMNLLDFELPPPPTPRSVPTVSIRELESLKSKLQSQISSLSASLSGKEAEVDSLAKAVADAERRVGEAQEIVRDERSAREYAEVQMEDWKKKGEEVQNLLQDVQSEMARNDDEREQLLARLNEAEKRAEEAESRSAELETKVIEAESKNVDMTTFINHDDSEENRKIYSEIECQAAIAEKVNEVARDLHSAYKAKHEKKIKALKDNYQKKADERCKELRVQIIRLERKVEEAEKKRDDTFSKVLPTGLESAAEEKCEKCGKSAQDVAPAAASNADDLKKLEEQKAELENLKAKLAGLQSELQSLRKSHDVLVEDLEAERIEKGELVAAAEQMLALCGEKMEEMQQEDFRRSQMAAAPAAPPSKPKAAPEQAMRSTGFLAGGSTTSRPGSALGGGRPASGMSDRLGAMGETNRGGSGIAKPSGLRAPGGFGFQGGASGLNRSTSGSKSRLLSNIERMGGGKNQGQE